MTNDQTGIGVLPTSEEELLTKGCGLVRSDILVTLPGCWAIVSTVRPQPVATL